MVTNTNIYSWYILEQIRFTFPLCPLSSVQIAHSVGNVVYDVTDFIDKNKVLQSAMF